MELQMADNNILFDEDGAALYVGGSQSPLSARTMQRWRLEGIGPNYVKLGRLVRYRKSDLDRFIDERTHSSTSACLADGEE